MDRRAHDPFAPAATAEPARPSAPVRVPAPLPDDLDDLRKAELVELAEQRGVDSSGTKADIIARLEA